MITLLDTGIEAKGTTPILRTEDRGANSPKKPAVGAFFTHHGETLTAPSSLVNSIGARVGKSPAVSGL
jgi:hypothetical protein